MGIIIGLIIGGIVGWLAAKVAGRREGILTSIVIGVTGAIIGGVLSRILGLGGHAYLAFSWASVFWSFVGSLILVAILNALQHGPRHHAGV